VSRHFRPDEEPRPKHLRADAEPVEEGGHFLPDETVSDPRHVLAADNTVQAEPIASEPESPSDAEVSQAGQESAQVAAADRGSGEYLAPRRARSRNGASRASRGRAPKHRRLVLAVSAVVALALGAGAGVAFAFFSSSGSGSGSGSTGSLQPVTVTALTGGDTASPALSPGGPAADVVLRVDNPNAQQVTLVSVTGNSTITADPGHPDCTTTGVTFVNQSGLSVAIAASTTTLVDLPGAASMSAASSMGCQGAKFSIPVSITVHE